MLIDEMHYRFNLGVDRVASQDRPDFYPNEIDNYLNRAIEVFVKDRYGLNNRKDGFETNQERISNLMTLHIKCPGPQPPLRPTEISNGIYELSLSLLRYRYLFLTSAKLVIEQDDCEKTIDYTAWQIDDSKNLYNEPSFVWSRVHANFGRSTAASTSNIDLPSIYFDTLDKTGEKKFNIKHVYVNYIKRPDRVCLGTYKHIDDLSPSAVTTITHCDIDDSFHQEIVNIAVTLAEADVRDAQAFQIHNNRTQSDK